MLVLISYLCVHVKSMYQLYCILKDQEEPPTPDKIATTAGKKKLNGNTEAKYIKKLESASENIKKVFKDK
jgi:hypothetical protein